MQHANFDMNLLRTLNALFAEKSVTRAAERLCVSQPALSGALQRLREHFDDPLLIRMGRDMVLTPLAESLVVPIREALRQLQTALDTRPTFDPLRSQRQFNLAISDYSGSVLMPSVLQRLSTEAPGVGCHAHPVNHVTFGQIDSGDVDMLVTVDSCELASRRQAATDALKVRHLFTDDFVCVVDQDHPAAHKALTLADYAALAHILVALGPQLDTLVKQAWRECGLALTIAATVPTFSAALFMLPKTRLVATVQRRLAQRMAKALGLTILESPVTIKALQQILVWHPRHDNDPGHRYLRQSLIEAGRSAQADRSTLIEATRFHTPFHSDRSADRSLTA